MAFKKKIMKDINLIMINNFNVRDKMKEFHKLRLNLRLIIILRIRPSKKQAINFRKILINYHFHLKVKPKSFSLNLVHLKAPMDL